MTDMEEQKMIEQAKSGDPKAQFELSQWARQMSILEPNEERWNRVAAKCLVEAAQAGYGPAKQMVQALISGEAQAPAEPVAPIAEEAPAPTAAPTAAPTGGSGLFSSPENRGFSFYDQEEEVFSDAEEEYDEYEDENGGSGAFIARAQDALKKAGTALANAVSGLTAALRKKNAAPAEEAEEADMAQAIPTQEAAAEAKPAAGSHSRPRSGFAGWIDDNWNIVRIVCIAVCVVLAILILVLLLPGKDKQAETLEEDVAVAITLSPTEEPTPVPTQEPFPNEATLLEIKATSTLQYRPGDSDASAYLPAATTFTVIEPNAENLRQGPSAGDYPDVIMQVAEGTIVTAYARYENSDGIVWYLINSGGTWGWMYGPSLG